MSKGGQNLRGFVVVPTAGQEPVLAGLQYNVMNTFTLTSVDATASTSNRNNGKPITATGTSYRLRALSFVDAFGTASTGSDDPFEVFP